MKNEKNAVELTKSQAKRAARKKEADRLKKQAKREKLIGYSVIAVFVLIITAIITLFVIKNINRVVPSDSYSACLEDNGFIKNTGAADIEIPAYDGISVPLAEVEYTDDELNEYIDSMLDGYKSLNDDNSLKVVSGDEISLDYTGKIDGVEFEGGSAQDYTLVIGSGDFIPGFEDQLIDSSVGSTFDINVTFPEDYSEDLAGKDAVFTVSVKGIYQKPELTDEFVTENFKDVSSTVDEYKQYIKDTNYDSNLTEWIENYLESNSTLTRIDKKYMKNLKSVIKYEANKNYEYMNEMYQSILGYNYYNSFEDYVGMSESEYDKSLEDTAKDSYKKNMVYQAIFEVEGASLDGDYAKNLYLADGYDEESFNSQVDTYGMPYINQIAIKNKVLDIVKEKVVVQ